MEIFLSSATTESFFGHGGVYQLRVNKEILVVSARWLSDFASCHLIFIRVYAFVIVP